MVRVMIVVLTIWSLVVIVPDVLRPFSPLGSIGMSADNDGRVIAVDPDGPAARAGIVPFRGGRRGDAIALDETPRDDLIEIFGGLGGMQYLTVGRNVTLDVRHADGTLQRYHVRADEAPLTLGGAIVLELDELLGIGFILLALFLVWAYPRRSTLGFFLFAIWFNPGQYFWLYAHLTPGQMLAEETLQAVSAAAGVAGFLAFALRFPNDRVEGWRATAERLLPVLFVALAGLGLASFGTQFGHPSELVTRVAYGLAYATYPLVVVAFVTKLRVLASADALRLRWAIAGCIPGLFFFILADSIESTSMWQWLWDRLQWTPPETWLNLAYMVNALVAVSVAYAVIRQRVLPIAFLVNRGLVLGIVWATVTMAVELLLVVTHNILQERHFLSSIVTALVIVGAAPLLERFEEIVNHAVDHVLFRPFHEAVRHLHVVASALGSAVSVDGVDRRLVEAPCDAFGIASGAVFRALPDRSFALAPGARGWDPPATTVFVADDPLVLQIRQFATPVRPHDLLRHNEDLPAGPAFPAIVIPLVVDRTLDAFVVFGGHTTGTDLSPDEIATLVTLAEAAAAARDHLQAASLRAEVTELRGRLQTAVAIT